MVTRAQTPLVRWRVPCRYTSRMELKPTQEVSKKYSGMLGGGLRSLRGAGQGSPGQYFVHSVSISDLKGGWDYY